MYFFCLFIWVRSSREGQQKREEIIIEQYLRHREGEEITNPTEGLILKGKGTIYSNMREDRDYEKRYKQLLFLVVWRWQPSLLLFFIAIRSKIIAEIKMRERTLEFEKRWKHVTLSDNIWWWAVSRNGTWPLEVSEDHEKDVVKI